MTTIRGNTRKPDPQGDDRTQPSKSPGEIEGGTTPRRRQRGGTDPSQGQRGVSSPAQPGRRDRQDPNEYPGGSDKDQGQGDDDLPPPDPQRST